MKNTTIYQGRNKIGQFKCTGNYLTMKQKIIFWSKHYTKLAIRTGAFTVTVVWLMLGTFKVGQHYFATVTVVQAESVKELPAVMKRIAVCESNDKHLNPKTGQVYMLGNTNKTVDVGRFMINSVWHKQAKELGYDITKEEDNTAFAVYLYENYGTIPWNYSSKCWNQ